MKFRQRPDALTTTLHHTAAKCARRGTAAGAQMVCPARRHGTRGTRCSVSGCIGGRTAATGTGNRPNRRWAEQAPPSPRQIGGRGRERAARAAAPPLAPPNAPNRPRTTTFTLAVESGGPPRVHLGSTWGPAGVHLGSTQGPPGVRLGCPSGPAGAHLARTCALPVFHLESACLSFGPHLWR